MTENNISFESNNNGTMAMCVCARVYIQIDKRVQQ